MEHKNDCQVNPVNPVANMELIHVGYCLKS